MTEESIAHSGAGEDATPHLSPRVVLALAEQYQHRLLSLEAELRDSSSRISKRAYGARARTLSALQHQIAQIRLSCEALGEPAGMRKPAREELTRDLGLPLSANCSPLEVDVCERFVAEKGRFLSQLDRDAGRVLGWVRRAIAGKSNALASIWHLSWLRRRIAHLDLQTQMVVADCQTIDSYIERFVRSLGRDLGKFTARDLVDGLVTVFTRLDQSVARVARLRTKLKQEQRRLSRMEVWLSQHEGDAQLTPRAMRPPTPLESLCVGFNGDSPDNEAGGSPASAALRRLTLARRFVSATKDASGWQTTSERKAGTGGGSALGSGADNSERNVDAADGVASNSDSKDRAARYDDAS